MSASARAAAASVSAKSTASTTKRRSSKKVTTTKTYKAKPATKAKGKATSIKASLSHPSWKEMITECIVANKEDARQGVSRSMIKKYAEERYKLDLTGSKIYQLNRAITTGAEKGLFTLPKGPSGKVKLTAKGKSGASKENSKPGSKKTTTTTKK